MASIHRRPRSPFYWAAWRQAGRLVFRSTKSTDKAVAVRIADELEQAGKAATAGTLVESQARAVLTSIMARANMGETLRTPTVKAFFADWMQTKEQNRASRTADRYEKVVQEFLKSLGERANRPLTGITGTDVQRFIDARLAEGCAPGTVQVDGKILRTAFNRARRLGLINTNPAEAVELPARESVERGTFTNAEVRILVDAAEGEWKTVILVGYYTGARLTECTRIRWEDVDLLAGTMTFQQTKQGKPHTVPLHPDLVAHLELIAGGASPGFLAPKLGGVKPSGRRGLSEQFKRICRDAGIDCQMVKGSGMNQVSKRSFHALRHSFTSALANAGVSEELRMKLTGHSSESVHKGYTHHEIETLRAAVSKLPNLK